MNETKEAEKTEETPQTNTETKENQSQAIESVDWNTYTQKTVDYMQNIDTSLMYNIVFLGCLFGLILCKMFYSRLTK